ncbi:hypothetical protein Bbelb_293340 [Branchiostoma belcheri]|nr:hypothetical protein Bbelb_293340 [Branchiostoma belcheri]
MKNRPFTEPVKQKGSLSCWVAQWKFLLTTVCTECCLSLTPSSLHLPSRDVHLWPCMVTGIIRSVYLCGYDQLTRMLSHGLNLYDSTGSTQLDQVSHQQGLESVTNHLFHLQSKPSRYVHVGVLNPGFLVDSNPGPQRWRDSAALTNHGEGSAHSRHVPSVPSVAIVECKHERALGGSTGRDQHDLATNQNTLYMPKASTSRQYHQDCLQLAPTMQPVDRGVPLVRFKITSGTALVTLSRTAHGQAHCHPRQGHDQGHMFSRAGLGSVRTWQL